MDDAPALAALVIRARSGDLDAFDALVRRFQDMAVGYAYSILGELGAAQDAAQEAFIQLYADLPKLRSPEAFISWFRRIIFKQCDRQRRGRQMVTVPLDVRLPASASADHPARLVEEREAADRVDRALQALPEGERAALVLFHFQEASLTDIAAFLGLTRSAVDHRLRSARRHFKEGILTMLHNDLQANRPSNDTRFLVRVMDNLTGLANRQGFDTRLAEEFEIGRATGQGFGLVLLDVDNYRDFNTARGHIAGDCLLAALAKQIQPLLHATDFVARYAGDQLAAIVRRADLAEVAQLAETFRLAVATTDYRLGDLLRPEARHTAIDFPTLPSAADADYQQGMRYLQGMARAEATAAFRRAVALDAGHVPSIMELEYLKLRESAEPATLAAPFRVTVSGGAAWYRPGDGSQSLLDRADQLLQAAKQNGRNQVCVEGA